MLSRTIKVKLWLLSVLLINYSLWKLSLQTLAILKWKIPCSRCLAPLKTKNWPYILGYVNIRFTLFIRQWNYAVGLCSYRGFAVVTTSSGLRNTLKHFGAFSHHQEIIKHSTTTSIQQIKNTWNKLAHIIATYRLSVQTITVTFDRFC